MGLFAKTPNITPTAVTERPDAAERPELWVPDDLAEAFANAPEEWRHRITPLEHPDWLATLRGDDRVSMSGKPIGLLYDHLTAALGAIRYGYIPGSIPSPSMADRWVSEPVKLSNGEDSSFSQMTRAVPTDEDREARARWHDSEDAKGPFHELVASTVTEVLADAPRSWDAYVHIALLERVRDDLAHRAEAAKRHENARRNLECPVCGEWNGRLAARPLMPNHDETRSNYAKRRTIRSCLPCWHEAVTQERARVAQLPDGRTRAQAVADHLSSN